MFKQSVLLLLACNLSACLAINGSVPAPNISKDKALTPQEHAELGKQHAELFPGLVSLCDIEAPFRNATIRPKPKASGKSQEPHKKRKRSAPIAPTQVFDNLYFVGTGGVSSWVIKTSNGLILIDALNNNAQAEKYIEQGMLALGLDPNELKYLIITHGHGDHYGGQEFLVKKYGVRPVMSDIEWTRLEQPQQDFASPNWGIKPTRDISINDGDVISLGDIDVSIYLTPGHTPGTISLIFPVFDQGKEHMVSLWGGTGLNYGPVAERIAAYSVSAKRFGDVAKQAGVDIFMSNHPKRDDSAEKLINMPKRLSSQPHPFVIGKRQALKAFDLLHHCTLAQSLRVEAGNF